MTAPYSLGAFQLGEERVTWSIKATNISPSRFYVRLCQFKRAESQTESLVSVIIVDP